MFRSFPKSLAWLAIFPAICYGQSVSFEDGLDAYNNDDFEQALTIFSSLTDQNHAESMYWLAVMNWTGSGVEENPEQAIEYYRRASYLGHSDSSVSLARIYTNGLNVPANYSIGFDFALRGAIQGNGQAQRLLGESYARGRGVSEDVVMAHTWFNLAAANGVFEADSLRDNLEISMSRVEIEQAQNLATFCFNEGLENCN